MNKNKVSRLTGMGLLLIGLLLLAGCQPEEVVPVEAAPVDSILSEEAAAPVRVDPADRKFYSGAYVARSGVSGEVTAPVSIAPADRKFFNAGADPPAGIHAADRKFVIGAHAVPQAVETISGIDAADRKFYNDWYALRRGVSGETAVPASLDPADRKFYNAGSDPQANNVHPADRKFFAGE